MMYSAIRRFAYLATTVLLIGVASITCGQTAQAGGGLGLAIPAGDLGGSTRDYYSGTRYGLASGWNGFLKMRLGLVGIGFTGEVALSALSNSGNSQDDKGSVQVEQSILSLRIGPEFSFGIATSSATGYLGANIALNSITGSTVFQGVSKVASGTYDVEGTVRMGVGISTGILFSLAPTVRLDIGANYNIVNLLGKSWAPVYTGGILSSDNRIDSYLALHDDPDPLYKGDDAHFIAASRSIQTVELRLGVMFGI